MKLSIVLLVLIFSLPSYADHTHSNTSLIKNVSQTTILIATHIEPPLVYIEKETFKGSNVRVAHLLAERMNMKAEFIYCPFARCLAMTKEGQADMMVSLNKTEERQAYFGYLERPFRHSIFPVRFYLTKDSELIIEDYEDLKPLTIGVLRGASYYKRFDKDKSLKKIEATSHTQLIDLLLKKRIDTFLGREISIKTRVDQSTYENDMKMSPYVYTKKQDSYIIISKKSPLYSQLDEFSKTLNTLIDSGEIAEIFNSNDVK